MSTILITGSSGFIGYNLAKTLLEKGDKIIGIDNENSDYDPKIKAQRSIELLKNKNFKFFKRDIVEDDLLKDLKNQRVDYVVHLAAKDLYYNNPFDLKYSYYAKTQILGTASIFEIAKVLKAKKFILASTHSVYGNTKKQVLTEKKVLPNPISPHGASKIAAEEVVRFMSKYHKIPSIIFRISTVYGPGMTEHMFIPSIIKNLKQNLPIKTYVDLKKSKRDFIYIDDCINFLVSSLNKRIKFQVINLGSGKSVSLYKILEIVSRLLGKKIPTKIDNQSQNFKHIVVDEVNMDISRAKKILKTTPKIAPEEGLKRTVNFFE